MKTKLNLITHSIDSRRKEELDTLTQIHRKIHTHTHENLTKVLFIFGCTQTNSGRMKSRRLQLGKYCI